MSTHMSDNECALAQDKQWGSQSQNDAPPRPLSRWSVHPARNILPKVLFFSGLTTAAIGLLSPPLALTSGIVFAVLCSHPYAKQSARLSKQLLQLSVIALGFAMDFNEILRAGQASFSYTAIGIAAAIVLGLFLGRLLKVRAKASFLITAGTAICGGSAIAAIAPITNPNEEELAASLGTIFTLNSLALLLFPAIGFALHLTQMQFGLWSALAIHDTSSVVGAAARFGPQALAIGTVVKLTRALWIIPVAMITAFVSKSQARVKIPWFILFFCLAALAKTYLAGGAILFSKIVELGHVGLAVTLFLIGTGISPQTIKQAGPRVLLQGLILWIVVATGSLVIIYKGWIHL
jgi:uncharacterized integral membrane protein (TIGR00698 family)